MRQQKKSAVKGDWNAECDICKFVFKASELRERWDGFMVCPQDWEPDHPQRMRSMARVEDDQSVPWSRPESSATDVSGSDTWVDTSAEEGIDRTPGSGTFNNGAL